MAQDDRPSWFSQMAERDSQEIGDWINTHREVFAIATVILVLAFIYYGFFR